MKRLPFIVFGTSAVMGWLIIFGVGLFIASKPYRDQLAQQFDWPIFFLSLLTYTPTNIAALCLLAAFCGGCTSRLLVGEASTVCDPGDSNVTARDSDSQIYMREHPVGSLFRGFLVYVAYLAGVYISTNSPFAETTPDQYARSAGIISLTAFVVGYDPTLFKTLVSVGTKLKRE